MAKSCDAQIYYQIRHCIVQAKFGPCRHSTLPSIAGLPTQLTRAYEHAARYWARLRKIATTGIGLLPLESYDDFESAIRSLHACRTALWARIDSNKRSGYADEDERGSDA
jgi:hypothetical protein